MSGLGATVRHRVRGRPSITKSLRALLIRTHRFSTHRATTPADCQWAARVLDALTRTLAAAADQQENRP